MRLRCAGTVTATILSVVAAAASAHPAAQGSSDYARRLAAALPARAAAAAASQNAGSPNTDPNPRNAPVMVNVGPGTTDPSPRQIVRTSGDLLYLLAPDGTVYTATPPTTAKLQVWKANKTGTPTGFTAQDTGHAPGGGVNTVAAALDGAGVIHALWVTPNAINYGMFSTKTNQWLGSPVVLENTGWNNYGQGDEGAALAVDANGTPYAIWSAADSGGTLHAHFAIRQQAGWTKPLTVDDVAVHRAYHPAVAFAQNGDFLVAWLDGSGYTPPDGVVRTRLRHANGTWDHSLQLPDAVETSLDNSPSIMITADGVQHLTVNNGANQIRYWYNPGNGWKGDQQPVAQVTHDPVIGPDGAGGLYILGHATPDDNFRGLGDNKLRFHKTAGSRSWGPFRLVRDGYIDDASNARWSQFFFYHPEEVDFTFWNHNPQHTLEGDAAGYFLELATQTVTKSVLAGSVDLLASPDYNPAGSAEAFQVTAATSGTIGRLGWFLDDSNTATKVILGIYGDAGGSPSTLLGSCTLSGTAAGRGQWHECAVTGTVSITAQQSYWLAILAPTGGPQVTFRDTGSGGASVASARSDLSALPTTWVTGASYGNSPAAAYVVSR